MSSNTFTKYTKYTIAELERYVVNPAACVEKIEWIDIISVLPKYLNNIADGVKNYLSKKIGTYDRKIDGVILAFKNTKILSPLMAIRPNSVRIHMKIKTDFYIFKPINGSVVEGTIQYVSNNYLSAVIYRVFNVTIKLQSKMLLNIARGSEIKFIIKSYDLKTDLPYIEGELIDTVSKSDYFRPNGIETNNIAFNSGTHIAIKREKVSDGSFSSRQVACKPKTKDKIRNHKKTNTSNCDNSMLTDEEMEHSIAAILKSYEKEISDTADSVHDSHPLEQSQKLTSKAEDKSGRIGLKKKKKSKRCDIESMKEALLNEFASSHDFKQTPELKPTINCLDFVTKEKKSKKRKKDSVCSKSDDFEASIMSSLLKVAAEAEKEKITSAHKKESRKSVRFDDTITEVSFSALDSSELMEISYSKAQGMSSTLKNSV
ncbi:uncharacterized protein LOC128743052 [Sabethes cyaneus]|uniref:uncharacterized protein LOC128743052 n=1 Tax=Sabethes cyaneus TaxID=53552 RepID=UPI00221E2886|nr:uncharacterized protein LOC128743052 [Sabethes cyaneus]